MRFGTVGRGREIHVLTTEVEVTDSTVVRHTISQCSRQPAEVVDTIESPSEVTCANCRVILRGEQLREARFA